MSADQAKAELDTAAAIVETRAKLLRVSTERIAADAWHELAAHLREFVPSWYQQVLSCFSLYGVGLEYRDKKDPFVRLFSFVGPHDYNSTMEQGSVYLPLLKHGFVPIGYESDGNLWVLRSPFNVASPVYMFELTGWNGGEPTKRNGLVFAASRFSLLLCSMGISETSYDLGVTSLIWYEDGEAPQSA
jgi:hypothetical protein